MGTRNHNHQNDCPPKIHNGLWWKVPALVLFLPLYAGLKLFSREPGYINQLKREKGE